jgi:nitrogen-specific signal transduction histidine kinase
MNESGKKYVPAPPSGTSQSMAALAGGMADDFNNILTVVLGACSLIDMDDPANAQLLQYVALIRSSAERAAVLADSLATAGNMQANDDGSVKSENMKRPGTP